MLNPVSVLIDSLSDHLGDCYRDVFGPIEPINAQVLSGATRIALEHIATSDALYHDVDHTIKVTLVGQEILRGRHHVKRVTPEDWVHFIVALLFHDLGYVRGVCSGDAEDSFVIDDQGNRVTPPRGASDAFLSPYHVDRSKIFVRERAQDVPYIDAERIVRAIELTRFPVPDSKDHQETDTEAGLVRAADLIGQLADPGYLRKTTHLFYEFQETGMAETLGYTTPADLVDAYPRFFWEVVTPYIGDAIRYLKQTQDGRQCVANLHAHVFAIESGQPHLGPYRG